ncbi:uncharacterized protein [Penaeus vannamei]|uniref:Uncharacterized protein n=1 Tax=Penaeus vannamei TaxID=6689 RepID=A0A423SSH6_PENVA|nr:uncharacterized protein LOC113817847 [Penaeus vannamei]ROT67164.1 hypothetical protein C7M84_014770 [Penaeus vannamei]
MKVLAIVLASAAAVALALPAPQVQDAAQTTYPVIPYNYGYEVADVATNNFQNRAEIKLPNGDVFGSYSWLMPTNEIFTLSYNVTGNLGFQYSINITPVGVAQ